MQKKHLVIKCKEMFRQGQRLQRLPFGEVRFWWHRFLFTEARNHFREQVENSLKYRFLSFLLNLALFIAGRSMKWSKQWTQYSTNIRSLGSIPKNELLLCKTLYFSRWSVAIKSNISHCISSSHFLLYSIHLCLGALFFARSGRNALAFFGIELLFIYNYCT